MNVIGLFVFFTLITARYLVSGLEVIYDLVGMEESVNVIVPEFKYKPPSTTFLVYPLPLTTHFLEFKLFLSENTMH